jgi:cyclomaltodextrinase
MGQHRTAATVQDAAMSIDTPAWVRDAVFYQIFPDRFARSPRLVQPGPLESWDSPHTHHGFKGGDLYGVAEHLDHLQRLGVTAVYFNPVFQSASNHRYHTYDYLAVDPLLGGDGALRELIDACHERGMRVVLDGVFNHASRGFWPFNHVMEAGVDSPYREWFYLDEDALRAGIPLRAFPLVPEAADVSATEDARRLGVDSLHRLGYRAWWDLPALPKLRTENPHVREYLLNVAEYWLHFGIDGWRLDVAEEIPPEFWREFRKRVKAVKPDAYIVAEIWNERPDYLQGDMYDAYMNYPFTEATISFVAGEHLDMGVVAQHFEYGGSIRREDGPTFARRLEHVFSMYDPAVVAVQLNLLGSHDTPRLRTMCGGDVASVRLATLVQMTVPGAPSIYYGDEIGLEGGMDPACRGAYPWDEAAWDHGLLDYVRGATALRHANPTLRHGSFTVVGAAGMGCAYRRADVTTAYVVAINAGETDHPLEVWLPEEAGARLVAETWAGSGEGVGDVTIDHEGRATLPLRARDGVVWRAVRD